MSGRPALKSGIGQAYLVARLGQDPDVRLN